jgi:hypothetical protein
VSVQSDIEYLAGVLPHRGPNTHSERKAAEYLKQRLSEAGGEVSLDEFESPESALYMLAACYAEFLFVALISLWLPWIGLMYGVFVFALYLAELTGYPTISRMLPRFETQNVVARFGPAVVDRTYVVTAHYDSGKDTPLTRPEADRWLPAGHAAVAVCMFVVVGGCAARLAGVTDIYPWVAGLQWGAVVLLLNAAAILAYAEFTAGYARGAINNASGVAALLQLADTFAERPLEGAEVLLVATGSNQSWLNGARRLLRPGAFDRERTVFVNLDSVGHPQLCYVTAEGLLYLYEAPEAMVKAAERSGRAFGARPVRHRGWPTDLLVPLTRGYDAVGVTSRPSDSGEPARREPGDLPWDVNVDTVNAAADFTEDLLRRLNATPRD